MLLRDEPFEQRGPKLAYNASLAAFKVSAWICEEEFMVRHDSAPASLEELDSRCSL
jgi:hypothetical protein